MKTVNIKGKPYVMVNERIKALRENFKGYRIITDWIKIDMEECICYAEIENENGDVVATGTAFEKAGNGFINKTSHIENAETSAVGRALGMLGIGIDESIATAEEVNNAVSGQKKEVKTIRKKQVQEINSLLEEVGADKEKFLKWAGIKELESLPASEFKTVIHKIEQKRKEG